MIKSKCAKEPGMRPLVFLLFIVTATNSFTPSTLPSTLQPQPQTCNIGISTPTRVSPSYSSGRLDNLRFLDVHVKKCQPRSSSCLSMSATSASVATTTAIVTASTKARQFAYKKRFAIIMAFMTGWADFIFVKKFNFFPTMMTGNSLKMSYAMVDGRVIDVFFYLSIIFSYMMGVGIFRRAELSYKDKALNGLFAPLVTICFLMSDCLSWMNPSSKFVPAMLLSLAWGVINSVGSEVTGTLIFVVTGAMVSEIACMSNVEGGVFISLYDSTMNSCVHDKLVRLEYRI
jgi:hypothetical protein